MHLFDTDVRAHHVLAWILWVIGTAVVVLDMFLDHSDDVGHLGIILVAGGATLHIMGALRANRDHLDGVYALGREAAKDERLHSINR